MLRPFGSEQGNFSLFAGLVLLTGLAFSQPVAVFWVSGGAMMAWGAFGVWRLATISLDTGLFAKRGKSLPERLIATIDLRERNRRIEGHSRLHGLDIQLWFLLACLYALWALVSFFFPAPVQALSDMQISLNEFWQSAGMGAVPDIRLDGNRDALVRQMAFLFCSGVAAFIVHSFSYNEKFIQQAALILLPVFICGAAAVMWRSGFLDSPVVGDPSLRGAGAGAGRLVLAMLPDQGRSHSMMTQRWIEQGIPGAVAVYALYAVPGWALIRFAAMTGRKLVTGCGLLCLGLMAILDLAAVHSVWTPALLFVGTGFIALCWGHTAYLRPYGAPRLETA